MSLKIAFVSALELEHNNTKSLVGHPVHITGLGKILAASKMTEIICLHKPDLVINFGSCGNLKSHKVGEILKVGKVHNDIDGRPLTEYGVTPFSNHGIFTLDAASDIHCFTTDHFYDKVLHTDYRLKYLDMIASCNIVDMECYALASVCEKYKVPFHSYKWVSDDGESFDWRTNAAIGFENFKKMMEKTSF